MKNFILSAALSMAMLSSAAQAAPIDFAFSVSGTTNNWTYDFSVTNNLGADWQIYFFGVSLANPANAVDNKEMITSYLANWNNVIYGGTTTNYNVNWISPYTDIGVGPAATEHFLVSDTSTTALTEISWFAYGVKPDASGNYTDSPHLGRGFNPGFEGVNATILPPGPIPDPPGTVPEPDAYALLLAGMGMLGWIARRRKAA